MKILAVADLHGKLSSLKAIFEKVDSSDVVLLAGDITNFGSPSDAADAVEMARRHCANVFAVAGNCDSVDIDRQLAELGVSLAGRGRVLTGVGFQGLSGAPLWRGSLYEFSEPDLELTLEQGFAEIKEVSKHVILSHCPPRASKVDQTHLHRHVGSTALKVFIERTHPTLVVCGHVHEATGTEQLGNTTIVNCGPGGKGCYAIIELTDETKVSLQRI